MSTVALIPAYNESETIGQVIKDTQRHVDRVVVCDDGSLDDTYNICESAGVDVIQHHQNMGYGASLQSLFHRAVELGCFIAVTVDADGQHDPSYIPRLVEPIQSDSADLVIGSRFLKGEESQTPWVKELGVKIINFIIDFGLGLDISDSQSGYRAYRVESFTALEIRENGMGVSTEVLLKAKRMGLRILEVPVQVTHYEKAYFWGLLMHGFTVLFSTIRYLF